MTDTLLHRPRPGHAPEQNGSVTELVSGVQAIVPLLHEIEHTLNYCINREEDMHHSGMDPLKAEEVIYARMQQARGLIRSVETRVGQLARPYEQHHAHREIMAMVKDFVDSDLDHNVTTLVQLREHMLAWLNESIALQGAESLERATP